jgi:uncharacterized protein (DUF1810 family)
MDHLQRFRDAQNDEASGFAKALDEIRRAHKQGHWIWYVFPQLRGLGRSVMAETFGIDGEDEAIAYVLDAELRERLLTISSALTTQRERHVSLSTVMGSRLDAAKVISSMTLFGEVARRLRDRESCRDCDALAQTAATILAWGQEEGLEPCAFTRAKLSQP